MTASDLWPLPFLDAIFFVGITSLFSKYKFMLKKEMKIEQDEGMIAGLSSYYGHGSLATPTKTSSKIK